MNYDYILELENVKKQYKVFLLKDISFKLEPGFIMGLIGPNGAGKTTIIKLIMNLIKRDAGTIKIFGMDNIKYENRVKQNIGFVYDENYYYEELTPLEIKRIIAPFYNRWNENLFKSYLERFNIPERKKLKNFSRGMKTKFALAMAISHKPELIIMDEPTAGLDPVFRREILDILLEIIQDGKTSILFSTHITSDLDKIADYITFINQGRLVFSADKDEIFEKYAIVKGSNNILSDELKKELIGIKESNFGFEALTDNIKKIEKNWGGKILIEKAFLEDIMLYTVRGNKNC